LYSSQSCLFFFSEAIQSRAMLNKWHLPVSAHKAASHWRN
jgi:hypothetical protein